MNHIAIAQGIQDCFKRLPWAEPPDHEIDQVITLSRHLLDRENAATTQHGSWIENGDQTITYGSGSDGAIAGRELAGGDAFLNQPLQPLQQAMEESECARRRNGIETDHDGETRRHLAASQMGLEDEMRHRSEPPRRRRYVGRGLDGGIYFHNPAERHRIDQSCLVAEILEDVGRRHAKRLGDRSDRHGGIADRLQLALRLVENFRARIGALVPGPSCHKRCLQLSVRIDHRRLVKSHSDRAALPKATRQ